MPFMRPTVFPAGSMKNAMVGPFGTHTTQSQSVELFINYRHQLVQGRLVPVAPLPKELRHRSIIGDRLPTLQFSPACCLLVISRRR